MQCDQMGKPFYLDVRENGEDATNDSDEEQDDPRKPHCTFLAGFSCNQIESTYL